MRVKRGRSITYRGYGSVRKPDSRTVCDNIVDEQKDNPKTSTADRASSSDCSYGITDDTRKKTSLRTNKYHDNKENKRKLLSYCKECLTPYS
jgi:hypothetical protein